MAFSTAFALSALVAAVSAHGTVSGIVADGTYYGGWQLQYYYEAQNNAGKFPDTVGWSTEGLDNGFIDGNIGYDSPDIICHKNAAPGAISATVAAGGSVDFQWTTWPDSHVGPVITYLANCGGDCSSVDKTTLQWVKIDAVGLVDAASKKWATTDLIANNGTWTTTIPSSIAPGNYVARHEIIALHSAGQANGAQNYPQCVNLEITGSGTDSLSSGTLGTALYTNTDEGLVFGVYGDLTTYPIPGPALYSGAGSGGDGEAETPAPITTAVSSVAASSAVATPTPTTLATSAVATPSSAAVPSPTAVGTESPALALPEGFTVQDLLEWLSYALGNSASTVSRRSHARAVRV